MLIYFLQPTLGTTVVAAAFLLSAGTEPPARRSHRPRLLPDPRARRADGADEASFFRQLTLLWAAAEFVNVAITLWLLLSQSVGVFVVTRTVSSLTVTALAIGVSVYWFQRTMSNHCVFAPRRVRVASTPVRTTVA